MTAQQLARALGLAGLIFAAGTAAVNAQDAAVQRGDAKFQHSCAPCHGPGPGDDGRAMLPGTAALQIKYNGTVPAVLEARTGLTADVLKVFLRQGSWSMPPFRPTEVTDAEIEDIAAYVAESSKAAASAAQR
jgi:mono/diheme cytochrome c family protein